MTKAPVKRKQKQKQKQKVIQKTKVSQNVKIVIGDVKRKQVRRKTTGSKAGAKPNIVLNVTNPQMSNPYFQYFKEQMMNQQPVQGTTLKQNELLNEIEENKASRVGALHKLDQEPADVARELRAQAAEGRIWEAKVKQELERRKQELQSSIHKQPPQTPIQQAPVAQNRRRRVIIREEQPTENMYNALREQTDEIETAINEGKGEEEDDESPATPRQPAQNETPSTVVQSYERNPKGTVSGLRKGRRPDSPLTKEEKRIAKQLEKEKEQEEKERMKQQKKLEKQERDERERQIQALLEEGQKIKVTIRRSKRNKR